ncbi:MAG: DUF349 domain-containing protein [Bacteroidales bacterium]|nr:DUF349 domain-containing protein [Bacteroidales bacterium]
MEELSNNTAAENPQPEMTQEETMQQHPAGETATAPIEELVAETTEPETSAEPTPVAEPAETVAEPVEATVEETPTVEVAEPVTPVAEPVTPVAEPVEATAEEKQPEEITIPEIPEDIYDHFTKEEVVRTLEELVQNEDINQIKRQVSLLKIRFIHLNKEEAEQQRLEKASANAAEPADNNGETEKTDGAEAETEAGPKEEQLSESQLLDNRFHAAFATYKENKQKYIDRQEQQKAENLAAKKNLLDKLKVLIDSEISLKEIYDQFKAIQEEWKAIGPVPQADTTEIWQNYHFYVEKFFDKVRINKELRELDLKKNLESKIALCEKTEALLLEPSIFESFSRLQQYHNDWKEIGPVPEDKKEEIWARFKNASDLINQKRREHYEQMAQEQENNYQAKLALCLRAEEVTKIDFSSMKQMNEAGNIASELLKTWRTIGPAPKQHNDEIWNRFKNTLDNFFERKKESMQKIKDEQLDNYNRKVNLCIEAEAISQRRDWKKATEELLNLQKEWKSIGFVAKKQSDAVWKRFRKACDDFFAAKKEYFSNIEANEQDNMAKKEELIRKVAETPLAETREENLNIIKSFQREWTEIGYTPIAEKERLWKAFRAAIDQRFDQLRANESEMRKNNYQQHIQNILEDDNSSDALKKERKFLQNKIAQLTEDVTLWSNNLGFFASSKNADLLKAQFEKKIESTREEIKQLEEKLKLLKEAK